MRLFSSINTDETSVFQFLLYITHVLCWHNHICLSCCTNIPQIGEVDTLSAKNYSFSIHRLGALEFTLCNGFKIWLNWTSRPLCNYILPPFISSLRFNYPHLWYILYMNELLLALTILKVQPTYKQFVIYLHSRNTSKSKKDMESFLVKEKGVEYLLVLYQR